MQSPAATCALVYAAAFAAVATTCALLTFASPALALAPALLVVGGVAAVTMRQVSTRTVLGVLAVLLALADGDFGATATINKPLYLALFSNVASGVPSVAEMLAYALFGWTVIRTVGTWSWRTPELRLAAGACALFVLAALLAVAVGLAQGGQLRIVIWQTKGFPFLLVWAVVAFHAFRSADDGRRFLDWFAWANVVKAVHALFVFYVLWGGDRGIYEYLTSHVGSLYYVTTMTWLGAWHFTRARGPYKAAVAVAILLVLQVWIINDRRISVIGAVFTVVFAAPMAWRHLRRRHFAMLAAVVPLFLVYEAATWSNPDNTLRSLVVKEPTAGPDYRDVENYDLYLAVAEHPVVGGGYGFPFEQAIALPDVVKWGEILAWIPHNNLLMIWANGGVPGITALAAMIAAWLAAAVRLYRDAGHYLERTLAFVCFGVFVQWTLYVWADMAFAFPPSILLPGALVGLCFKLLHNQRTRTAA